uniref:Secreted protein n=1 Tax=Achlya hypogyna TaxID=1202772 RepID=A0A0A7CM75_ACHHY|nr:secreted protein [Achlya hypogyna]
MKFTPLVLIATGAVALNVSSNHNATALHKGGAETIEFTVKDRFPRAQWGIQRGRWVPPNHHCPIHRRRLGSPEGWDDMFPCAEVKLIDAWMTTWGSVVNTRCDDCRGGHAWEVIMSSRSSIDMLRNVQDDRCLEVQYVGGGGTGLRVFGGQPCNAWTYSTGRVATLIRNKIWTDACLAISDGGDARMEKCDFSLINNPEAHVYKDNQDQLFVFIA